MNYHDKYIKYKAKYKYLKNIIGGKDNPILVLVCGNKNKVSEIKEALGDQYPFLSIDIDVEEIQAVSVKKVTMQKIKDCYDILMKNKNDLYIEIDGEKKNVLASKNNIIVFCEDTGLGFEDMGEYKGEWYPGALIKFHYRAQKINNSKDEANRRIISHVGGSKASSESCFGVYGSDFNERDIQPEILCGIFKATVVTKKEKERTSGIGWDYDFILIPTENNPEKKTVAQLIEDGGNDKFDARAKAVKQLKKYLRDNNIVVDKLSEGYGDRILNLKTT